MHILRCVMPGHVLCYDYDGVANIHFIEWACFLPTCQLVTI